MNATAIRQGYQQWHQILTGNKALRFALAAVICVSMLSAGWKLWESSQLRVEHFAWPFAAAIGVATIHRFINAYGWALVLRAMRLKVDGYAATRIWLAAESRRWLPGGVWGYASRATMASQLGVNSVTATASMLLEMLLVILASATIVGVGIVTYRHHLEKELTWLWGTDAAAVSVAAILVINLLAWCARHRIKAKFQSVRNRFRVLQQTQVSISGLPVAALFFVAMNLLGGLITVVLIQTMDGYSSVPLTAILAASSAAWAVGFFAFLSPGGLLVREAALAAMLVPWMPYADGLTVAVLTRFAQLAAEGIAMLVMTLPTGQE